MKIHVSALLVLAPVLLLLMTGCATTQHDALVYDSAPAPSAEAVEPEPLPESVPDLLRQADEEFQAANKAQEEGDHQAALHHYSRMLELLSKADLDPSVYYSLRNEFARLLGTTAGEDEFEVPKWKEGTVAVDLPVPSPLPERVLREIELIQSGYHRPFQNGLDRSYKYLPYVKAEFKKAGLPEDLAWLAMVESQFSPKIDSKAGAGGMFQFMRATGTRYGLRTDRYVDERYDWKKATGAAIAYLQDLYTMFGGDWPLAISAYNMGEYGLERAILASGGEHDLWRLMETPPASQMMKDETKGFYPKLLASIIVGKDPERYGFASNPQDPEQTVAVQVEGSYSLAALDKACGLLPGTLQRLNPHFIKGATAPDYACSVAVPVEHHEIFLASLKQPEVRYAANTRSETPSRSRSSSERAYHTVRRGETIAGIADRYHVSAQELMRINKITSARTLRSGKRLVIPGESAVAAVQESEKSVLKVRPGDTLHDIAVANNVTVQDLQKWNGLEGKSLLHPGDELVLKATPGSNAMNVGYYTVKSGDTLGKIAQSHGMGLSDLLAWNGLKKDSVIVPGAKLRVKDTGGMQAVERVQASASDVEKITHTVVRGETASSIAQKYGVSTADFLKWNHLTGRSVIRSGQECVIYKGQGEPMALAAVTDEPKKAAAEEVVHVVARGQSPWTIAQKYGVSIDDLAKWNKWGKNPVLRVGDKVVIHK